MKFTRLLLVTVAVTAPASLYGHDAFFERRIRPVLVETCLPCPGGKKAENGLRVDSREALLHGGDRGAALVPGKAGESLLMQAVRRTSDSLAMPPGKRLPVDVVADFARWIDAGVNWPDKNALSEGHRSSFHLLENSETGRTALHLTGSRDTQRFIGPGRSRVSLCD